MLENKGKINMEWLEMIKKSKLNKHLFFWFFINSYIIFILKLSNFWFELLIGTWVSFFFYFLVVVLPDYHHRQRQKIAFLVYYQQFKEDVIQELFHLIDYKEKDVQELRKKLLDTEEFRKFFKQDSLIEGQTYTHVLLNALTLDSNKVFVERISKSFQQLETEIDYLTRSNMIEDTTLLVRLRTISRLMGDGRLNPEIDPDREDESRFVNALFEVFSGWNIVSGKTGDFIKEWVEKI